MSIEVYADGNWKRIADLPGKLVLHEATDGYEVLDNDGYDLILAATNSVDCSIMLPTASDNVGRVLRVLKTNYQTSNNIAYKVTIDGEGSETINGASTFNLVSQFDYVELLCAGSEWRIFGAKSTYDTSWINRSYWTNVHLGSNKAKNTDSNVTHNLNAHLPHLSVKLIISTDGTDAASFEVGNIDRRDWGATGGFGWTSFAVDADSFKIQTAANGITYLGDDGIVAAIDTEDWYYKVRVAFML